MLVKSPLPAEWELPREIRNRFGERAGKQRCMVEESHLLLALHVPPKAGENERQARFFWRKPDGSWLSSKTPSSPASVMSHLDEFQVLLEKIDRAVDNATLARDYFAVMSHLAPLLRTVRHLHTTLQEARSAVSSPELITWRDRAYELERTEELLYEDARNGLDFATARRVEQQSEASHRMEVAAHRLNLLAAFFFPLATLTSVFGVNLRHGFEQLEPPIPFLALIGIGVLLGVMLTLFVSWNMPTAKKLNYADADHKRL